jgi:hypothetical protein
MDDKFISNRLNVGYRAKIDQYSKMKMLVMNAADPNTGMVNSQLFKSYIKQVDLRQKITGSNHIREMTMALPQDVVKALKSKDEKLDNIHFKIDFII